MQHWFVHIPGTGWARFPARTNGWTDYCMVPKPDMQYLSRVPLWLAFNTGLLEGVRNHDLRHAA